MTINEVMHQGNATDIIIYTELNNIHEQRRMTMIYNRTYTSNKWSILENIGKKISVTHYRVITPSSPLLPGLRERGYFQGRTCSPPPLKKDHLKKLVMNGAGCSE